MVQIPADPIEATPPRLERLHSFVPTRNVLSQYGYITKTLQEHDLESKMKCGLCGEFLRKKNAQPVGMPKLGQSTNLEPSNPTKLVERFVCRFHPGHVVSKYWTCCGEHVSSKPCTGQHQHMPRTYKSQELSNRYQYHKLEFAPTQSEAEGRTAVAIDCEMGTNDLGEPDLIRLSVIDLFTCEVLIDSLVWPDNRMQHYNTRFSGVTRKEITEARRKKECINGIRAVRTLLSRYIGPRTIIVGHGLQSDCSALRIVHTQVVDTYIIWDQKAKQEKRRQEEIAAREKQDREDREARGETPIERVSMTEPGKDSNQSTQDKAAAATKRKKGTGPKTLKTLVKTHLGLDIQQGNKGHDSLEDAIAARNLAVWLLMQEETT